MDPTGDEPWDFFGPENICLDLMKHWSTFTMEHICLFQKDTNKAASDDENVISATWVKDDDWVPEGAYISDDEESFDSSVCQLAESEGNFFERDISL